MIYIFIPMSWAREDKLIDYKVFCKWSKILCFLRVKMQTCMILSVAVDKNQQRIGLENSKTFRRQDFALAMKYVWEKKIGF